MTTKTYKPATQRIRELEKQLQHAQDLLEQARRQVTPSLESRITLSIPVQASETDLREMDTVGQPLKSMLILRKNFDYGPCSGPALIISLLEFFEVAQSSELQCYLSDLFDKPLPRSQDSSSQVPLPSQPEILRLSKIVNDSTHPLLYFAKSLDISTIVNMSHSPNHDLDHIGLLRMLIALGMLLDVEAHDQRGCRDCDIDS